MDDYALVLNAGSSSLKFCVYRRPEVEAWRLDLHRRFDAAFENTKLPERPDYEKANELLIKARRSRV
jgi:acetate kinase